MWTCKKCNTENVEYVDWCKKCNKQRIYPFKLKRFLLVTLALTAISMPGFIIAINYFSFLLLFGVFFLYIILAACLVVGHKPKYSGIISIAISLIFGLLAMIIYADYSFKKDFEVYKSTILTISYITLFLAIIGIITYFYFQFKKEKIEQQRIDEANREKEKIRQEAERQQYGIPTKIIESYGYDCHSPLVRVFLKSKIIEINESKIKFENIVDYSVGEDVISELHMSKPSMIRRGIAGGLLYGKIGACVGVATAEKYIQTDVDYTVYIRLKSGAVRQVRTEDAVFVDELCSELESIIYQNSLIDESAING